MARQLSRSQGVWRPFAGTQYGPAISYLHEREHKRELRRDQAKESTAIAESTYLDQERSLLFNLQTAFVNVLQAKAFLQNAQENLSYWDRELGVNRTAFPGRRPCAGGSEPPGVAAGSVRIGL